MTGFGKRFGIELASLRQFLWRRRGEPAPDWRLLEKLPSQEERTDLCCWIGSTVMPADCSTKLMKEDFLLAIVESNKWNTAQTHEASAVQVRKAQGAQPRKVERQANDDASSVVD